MLLGSSRTHIWTGAHVGRHTSRGSEQQSHFCIFRMRFGLGAVTETKKHGLPTPGASTTARLRTPERFTWEERTEGNYPGWALGATHPTGGEGRPTSQRKETIEVAVPRLAKSGLS